MVRRRTCWTEGNSQLAHEDRTNITEKTGAWDVSNYQDNYNNQLGQGWELTINMLLGGFGQDMEGGGWRGHRVIIIISHNYSNPNIPSDFHTTPNQILLKFDQCLLSSFPLLILLHHPYSLSWKDENVAREINQANV